MKKSQIERVIQRLLEEREAIDLAISKLRDQAALVTPKKRKQTVTKIEAVL